MIGLPWKFQNMPFDYKNITWDSYGFASISLSKGISTKFFCVCRIDPPPPKLLWELPGGPVVKTLSSQYWGHGFSSWPGD